MTYKLSKTVMMSLALGMKIDDGLLKEMHAQDVLLDRCSYYSVWSVWIRDSGDVEKTHDYVKKAFPEEVEFLFFDGYDTAIFVAAGNEKKALIDNALDSACDLFSMENGKAMFALSDGNILTSFVELPEKIKKCVEQINDYKEHPAAVSTGVHYVEEAAAQSTMVSPAEISGMLRLFEKGKFDEFESVIDGKVEEIRENNAAHLTSVPPTSIKRFFVELITFAAHTAYDYGVDVDQIMDYEDPYQIIFAMSDTPSIKAWLIDTCKRLYEACQRTAAQDRNSLVIAVEKYIRDNVNREDFGVAEIAETFKLSPAYLSSCYSASRGSTIIKYINQLRLENACRYLEQTEEPVSEICRKTGYSSINYFYSCFRKKFGQTPSEYRQKTKNV